MEQLGTLESPNMAHSLNCWKSWSVGGYTAVRNCYILSHCNWICNLSQNKIYTMPYSPTFKRSPCLLWIGSVYIVGNSHSCFDSGLLFAVRRTAVDPNLQSGVLCWGMTDLATCAYGFSIWRSLARELPGDLKLQSQRTALERTLALDAAWSG